MVALPIRDGKPPEPIDALPCPFCGGKPYLQKYESYERADVCVSWIVKCTQCMADTCLLEEEQEDAIENWNRRSEPATADLIQRQAEQIAAATWRPMSTAPRDGKHVILAVKSDAFVYAVQGAFLNGKWMNAADIKSKPLCWMPKPRIPDKFLPWLKSEGSES